jgi:hypothetical protein
VIITAPARRGRSYAFWAFWGGFEAIIARVPLTNGNNAVCISSVRFANFKVQPNPELNNPAIECYTAAHLSLGQALLLQKFVNILILLDLLLLV